MGIGLGLEDDFGSYSGRRAPALGRLEREAVTPLLIPGDVQTEQQQVPADDRSGDRGDQGEEALDRVEAEPGADKRASDGPREAVACVWVDQPLRTQAK